MEIPEKTSGITIEPSLPYSFTVDFDSSNRLSSALIATKQGVLLDAFRWTNGVFQPVESSFLQRVNDIGADTQKLFDSKNVQNATPEQFNKQVQELIKKHKAK